MAGQRANPRFPMAKVEMILTYEGSTRRDLYVVSQFQVLHKRRSLGQRLYRIRFEDLYCPMR